MMPTDESLMLAVRNGEVDQFAVLFERHHDRLFSFFYRMTADQPASEDLTQEVFVRMLKYRGSFGEDSDFRAWMYQIARNVRADHFRKRMAETELPVDMRAHERSASVQVERDEELSVLQRALLALPEDKREILILARYEEMKYEAIAAPDSRAGCCNSACGERKPCSLPGRLERASDSGRIRRLSMSAMRQFQCRYQRGSASVR